MYDKSLIESLSRGRVAIIGDLMVDHYVTGAVSRISPEAPVPVLRVSDERHVLGGAGNVAANIAALGGKAQLVGMIADDPAGQRMMVLLDEADNIEANLVISGAQPTIIKTRYVSGQQQILRVDRETEAETPPAIRDKLIHAISGCLEDCDALILSDYGKGALSPAVIRAAIGEAKRQGKPVLVDPKRRDFSDYAGASYITPNRRELSEATSMPCTEDDEAQAAAAAAMEQSGAAILLTRSERGMTLYRADQPPFHVQSDALEVFDVSGAGDTVAAALALSLAVGASVERALHVANTAAGVVVGKRGTATCSAEELLAALERKSRRPDEASGHVDVSSAGVTSRPDAVAQRRQWEKEGFRVGFANGCFDLIHPGHVGLLRQAAAACDRLIVAINTDESVRRLKGPTRPIQPEEARAQVLNAIKGVDLVVTFGEDTPLELVTALQPDLIVKGTDYREEDVVGGDIVKARGGKVLLVDLVDGQSTSAIVSRSGGQDA